MDAVEHQIRERAHLLWKQAGEPEGHDLHFWFEAQTSVMSGGTVSRADESHTHPAILPAGGAVRDVTGSAANDTHGRQRTE